MHPLKFLLAGAVATMMATQALAVTPETADTVVARFSALPIPTAKNTRFERWAWTTMLLAASECWVKAHPGNAKGPAALNRRPAIAGSYTSHGAAVQEQVCQALAREEFAPRCPTLAHVLVEGVERDPTLPHDYLQVGADWQRARISGGLYCNLNSFQGGAQFFPVEEFQATWQGEPRPQVFNTPSGTRTLNAGNVMLRASAPGSDGQPFWRPVIAVAKAPR